MLLKLLQDLHEISPTNVTLLKQYIERWRVGEYDSILDCHILTEERLAQILAAHYGLQQLRRLNEIKVSLVALNEIGFLEAKKLLCLPISYTDESKVKLRVLVANPTDVDVWAHLEKKIGKGLEFQIASRSLVIRAIHHSYPNEMQMAEIFNLVPGLRSQYD